MSEPNKDPEGRAARLEECLRILRLMEEDARLRALQVRQLFGLADLSFEVPIEDIAVRLAERLKAWDRAKSGEQRAEAREALLDLLDASRVDIIGHSCTPRPRG